MPKCQQSPHLSVVGSMPPEASPGSELYKWKNKGAHHLWGLWVLKPLWHLSFRIAAPSCVRRVGGFVLNSIHFLDILWCWTSSPATILPCHTGPVRAVHSAAIIAVNYIPAAPDGGMGVNSSLKSVLQCDAINHPTAGTEEPFRDFPPKNSLFPSVRLSPKELQIPMRQHSETLSTWELPPNPCNHSH